MKTLSLEEMEKLNGGDSGRHAAMAMSNFQRLLIYYGVANSGVFFIFVQKTFLSDNKIYLVSLFALNVFFAIVITAVILYRKMIEPDKKKFFFSFLLIHFIGLAILLVIGIS